MTNKKTKIISISLEPEMVQLMEEIANKTGITNRSQIIRMVLKHYQHTKNINFM